MRYSTERETIAFRKEFWFSSMLASLYITYLNASENHKFVFFGQDDSGHSDGSLYIWYTNTFLGFLVMFIIYTLVIVIARMLIYISIHAIFDKSPHPKDEIAELEKKIEKINIRIRNLKGDWSVEDSDDFKG